MDRYPAAFAALKAANTAAIKSAPGKVGFARGIAVESPLSERKKAGGKKPPAKIQKEKGPVVKTTGPSLLLRRKAMRAATGEGKRHAKASTNPTLRETEGAEESPR